MSHNPNNNIESVAQEFMRLYGSGDPLWRILGEDPNCDLAGSHIQPDLGLVRGKKEDVLAYAKTLPNWASWGGGGTLVPVPEPKHVKELLPLAAKRKDLEAKLAQLTDEIKVVEKELRIK